MPTRPIARSLGRFAARIGLPIAGLLFAAAVHAAEPTAETTQQQLAAGQVPTVSNFRADNGALVTWDNDVALTWTQQGQPTQWRVATNTIAFAQWMALPSVQPYKLVLGSNPSEGTHSLLMQLRNEHGESAVASTTIEYRQPPKSGEATKLSASDGTFKHLAVLELYFSGKPTRLALSGSAQPPAAAADWDTVPAGTTTPRTFNWDLRRSQLAQALVTGRSFTLWLHLQRDNGPVDTRPLSFVYTGPPHAYPVHGSARIDFVERLGRAGRIGAQRLSSAGGLCVVQSARTGGAYGQGVQGFYAVAGTTPMTAPVLCRFNVFDGKPLAPGWTLATSPVTLWQNDCRVVTVTGGASPNIALEVTLKLDANPTSTPKIASCHLDSFRLDGPWSEGEAAWRALP